MDKEREPIFTDGGYSEEQNDKNVDKVAQNDQVKAGNIFDPKKLKKVKKVKVLITDLESQ